MPFAASWTLASPFARLRVLAAPPPGRNCAVGSVTAPRSGMGLDHFEARCCQNPAEFGHRPSIASRRCVIERLYGCAFEETNQQPTTRPNHTRELGERCLDILRIVVDE